MMSVGRVMEFSAMTNATAPKSSEQISEKKTSTLAADNTDKFVQSGSSFTQAYTKATVTDNRSNNAGTSTMPDSNDAVQQAKERAEREAEEKTKVNDEPSVPTPEEPVRTKDTLMQDFVKQTLSGQVEDTRKSSAQRELEEILGTINDEEQADNYWSADETAYRILTFAEQLSGGDVNEFGTLNEAFEAGFRQSETNFGGRHNMPQVSYDTYDIVKRGFGFVLNNPPSISPQ